jgi:hypothetical protein
MTDRNKGTIITGIRTRDIIYWLIYKNQAWNLEESFHSVQKVIGIEPESVKTCFCVLDSVLQNRSLNLENFRLIVRNRNGKI